MQTDNIHEAKTQLSKLIEQAANDKFFIIAKAEKPMVKVTKIDVLEPANKKRLGFMARQISTPKDFDEMGKDEIAKLLGVE
jgi:antitoxin (DNA-binding transcriptional repressor) of toxin-antitoxin stability system